MPLEAYEINREAITNTKTLAVRLGHSTPRTVQRYRQRPSTAQADFTATGRKSPAQSFQEFLNALSDEDADAARLYLAWLRDDLRTRLQRTKRLGGWVGAMATATRAWGAMIATVLNPRSTRKQKEIALLRVDVCIERLRALVRSDVALPSEDLMRRYAGR